MKVKKTVVIWVITISFILLLGWYGTLILWSMSVDGNVPGILRWGFTAGVFLVLVPVIILMIITTLRRKHEIDEEDDDDLSKY